MAINKVNAHCPDWLVFRLSFAGMSADGCFVHLGAIGLFPSYEITKMQKARPFWAARGVFAHDLGQLRSSIAERSSAYSQSNKEFVRRWRRDTVRDNSKHLG